MSHAPLGLVCSILTAWTLAASQMADLPTRAPLVLKSQGLTMATLARDHKVQGLDLDAGTLLQFRPDGSLEGLRLVRTTVISGVPLPADTRVTLDSEGRLDMCFLPAEAEVQGLRLRGGGHNWMTCFHPNGRLRLAWLARDETIDGIPCRRTTFPTEVLRLKGWGGTHFHPSGRLARCTLARDAVIRGGTYTAGTRLHFDSEGQLLSPAKGLR